MESNKKRQTRQEGKSLAMLRKILAMQIVIALLLSVLVVQSYVPMIKETLHSDQTVTADKSGVDETEPPLEGAAEGEKAKPDESLLGESSTETITKPESTAEEKAANKKAEWIKSKLNELSVEEKVAQLFIIIPEQLTKTGTVTMAGDIFKERFDEYPVGGIIFLEDNLIEPSQTKEMLSGMQSVSMEKIGIPCFLALDEEGGKVTRIAKNPAFSVKNSEYLPEIGKTGEDEKAYELGRNIASYLKELGFNLDFAPVADVLTNSNNTVVKERSYGTDAELVSKMVGAQVRGMEEVGILSTLKHWPGHGNTSGDTHKGLTDSSADAETLKKREYKPFEAGIAAGADCVMVGHFTDVAITGEYTAASLSPTLIRPLRDELNFEGIIITDALNMGAIVDSTSNSGEAALLALKAGSDMLLMPNDFETAYRYVLESVKSDDKSSVSMERLNESVSRILSVKYDLMQQKNR